jgi:hypothetical protein
MREIHWDSIGLALGQALFGVVLLSLVWTLLGMLVMKYFVRHVPLVSHAIILFWAIFRVLLAVLGLTIAGALLDISAGPFAGLLSLLGMCAIGWLITRDLAEKYGTPTKFPAVGAKVMFSMLALTWIIIGIIYVVSSAFA